MCDGDALGGHPGAGRGSRDELVKAVSSLALVTISSYLFIGLPDLAHHAHGEKRYVPIQCCTIACADINCVERS